MNLIGLLPESSDEVCDEPEAEYRRFCENCDCLQYFIEK